MPGIRLRCRQRCASRIIAYLKDAVRVGRAQACIMRVQQQLRLIQRTWKALHAIRAEQTGLLMSQLVTFEGKVIAANRRWGLHALLMTGHNKAGSWRVCTALVLLIPLR